MEEKTYYLCLLENRRNDRKAAMITEYKWMDNWKSDWQAQCIPIKLTEKGFVIKLAGLEHTIGYQLNGSKKEEKLGDQKPYKSPDALID